MVVGRDYDDVRNFDKRFLFSIMVPRLYWRIKATSMVANGRLGIIGSNFEALNIFLSTILQEIR